MPRPRARFGRDGASKDRGVDQHLPNIPSEGFPVPDPEIEDFVPPEEEMFEAQRLETMVQAGHPLGHVCVFCLRPPRSGGTPGGSGSATAISIRRKDCWQRLRKQTIPIPDPTAEGNVPFGWSLSNLVALLRQQLFVYRRAEAGLQLMWTVL